MLCSAVTIESSRRALASLGEGHRRAHGGRDESGVEHRAEVDEPGAVGEAGDRVGRDLQCQARLADAPDAGERDHRGVVERGANLGQVIVSTDERAALHGQVPRVCVEGPQRRELGREIRMRQLHDALGPPEIAQAMLTEVDESDFGRDLVAHEVYRRRRRDDLPAVCSR